MTSQDDIPLCPISGWDIRALEGHKAVMIRLDFLAHPMQPLGQAIHSPIYVLTADRCRELAQRIVLVLHQLESGAPEGTGLPTH